MRRGANCPVCGREECGLHDSLLSFTHLLDPLTLIALTLVGGLVAIVLALAK
ncbi:MAG TPA: hypothetical protein VJ691_14800 [Vicinamibacterales bacterium]|nr:hypothetical protein [Vicinamibacterales bacterium]